jgi:DNA-binding YbaB/EbfC family protein
MEAEMSKKILGDIMKQAQMFQEQMARIQEEAGAKTVEATSGGGMVSVVANGRGEILSVKIEPQVVDSQDIEMLQDLIVAAVNEVIKKAQEMMKDEMGRLTGGLKIPGLF